MPNMSYCRFRNTLADMEDCKEALEEGAASNEGLDAEERDALKSLIALCGEIHEDFKHELE